MTYEPPKYDASIEPKVGEQTHCNQPISSHVIFVPSFHYFERRCTWMNCLLQMDRCVHRLLDLSSKSMLTLSCLCCTHFLIAKKHSNACKSLKNTKQDITRYIPWHTDYRGMIHFGCALLGLLRAHMVCNQHKKSEYYMCLVPWWPNFSFLTAQYLLYALNLKFSTNPEDALFQLCGRCRYTLAKN